MLIKVTLAIGIKGPRYRKRAHGHSGRGSSRRWRLGFATTGRDRFSRWLPRSRSVEGIYQLLRSDLPAMIVQSGGLSVRAQSTNEVASRDGKAVVKVAFAFVIDDSRFRKRANRHPGRGR